jgi:hypothetical protein
MQLDLLSNFKDETLKHSFLMLSPQNAPSNRHPIRQSLYSFRLPSTQQAVSFIRKLVRELACGWSALWV